MIIKERCHPGLRHASVFQLGEHCHHGPRHRARGDVPGLRPRHGQQRWKGQVHRPSPSVHPGAHLPACSSCKVPAIQAAATLFVRDCGAETPPARPRPSLPCRVSSDRHVLARLRTWGDGACSRVVNLVRISVCSHSNPRPRRKAGVLCGGPGWWQAALPS